MARTRFDRRGVKIHRTYTYEEAARLIGASRATVRRWVSSRQLPAICDQKPHLILGSDLRAFLDERATTKTPCPPGQCYCVKCRASVVPDGGMADFIQDRPKTGMLRGLCPHCGGLSHRRTSVAQMRAIQSDLDIRTTKTVGHLTVVQREGETSVDDPTRFPQSPYARRSLDTATARERGSDTHIRTSQSDRKDKCTLMHAGNSTYGDVTPKAAEE